MTPAELTAWRTRMGWLKGEAAKALGLSLNGYGASERGYVRVIENTRRNPNHVKQACERLEEMGQASPDKATTRL